MWFYLLKCPNFFPRIAFSLKLDFPHLANQGSWGTKNTAVKGTLGGSLGRQKSTSGRHAEHSLLSSPTSARLSLKGKNDAMTKQLEAMDFKDWCGGESVRLIGTKGCIALCSSTNIQSSRFRNSKSSNNFHVVLVMVLLKEQQPLPVFLLLMQGMVQDSIQIKSGHRANEDVHLIVRKSTAGLHLNMRNMGFVVLHKWKL